MEEIPSKQSASPYRRPFVAFLPRKRLAPHASQAFCCKQNLAAGGIHFRQGHSVQGPHETPFHGAGDMIEAFAMEEIPQ